MAARALPLLECMCCDVLRLLLVWKRKGNFIFANLKLLQLNFLCVREFRGIKKPSECFENVIYKSSSSFNFFVWGTTECYLCYKPFTSAVTLANALGNLAAGSMPTTFFFNGVREAHIESEANPTLRNRGASAAIAYSRRDCKLNGSSLDFST